MPSGPSQSPFDGARVMVARGLVVNRPEWFRDPDFMAWLNSEERTLFTWHPRGEQPGDWSDVIVLVDPSCSGAGDESDAMPARYWDELVRLCRTYLGSAAASAEPHFHVRITNLAD